MAGGLKDDIPDEVVGQGAVIGQLLAKALQLPLAGQMAQQQQVGSFLKAKAAVHQGAAHQLLHVDAPVVQLAVTGDFLPIDYLLGHDVGDLGQAGQDSLAVHVPQAPLHIVADVVVRVDGAVLQRQGCQRLDLRGDVAVIGIAGHRIPPYT